jgi:hypothetical protein
VVALLLAGGGALAQQGFIVEPWRKAAAVVAAPALPTPKIAFPASGLPPEHSGPASVAAPAPAAVVAAAPRAKWTPPVVPLLVDPWAKRPAVASSPHPRWVPQSTELIIDPWAAEAPRPASAEPSRRAGTPHSPIF